MFLTLYLLKNVNWRKNSYEYDNDITPRERRTLLLHEINHKSDKESAVKELETCMSLLHTLLLLDYRTILFVVGDSTSALREVYRNLPLVFCKLQETSCNLRYVMVPHHCVCRGPKHCQRSEKLLDIVKALNDEKSSEEEWEDCLSSNVERIREHEGRERCETDSTNGKQQKEMKYQPMARRGDVTDTLIITSDTTNKNEEKSKDKEEEEEEKDEVDYNTSEYLSEENKKFVQQIKEKKIEELTSYNKTHLLYKDFRNNYNTNSINNMKLSLELYHNMLRSSSSEAIKKVNESDHNAESSVDLWQTKNSTINTSTIFSDAIKNNKIPDNNVEEDASEDHVRATNDNIINNTGSIANSYVISNGNETNQVERVKRIKFVLPFFIGSLSDLTTILYEWSPTVRFRTFRESTHALFVCFVNTDLFKEIDELHYVANRLRGNKWNSEKYKVNISVPHTEIVKLLIPIQYNLHWGYNLTTNELKRKSESENSKSESVAMNDKVVETNLLQTTFSNTNICDNERGSFFKALYLKSMPLESFESILEHEWQVISNRKANKDNTRFCRWLESETEYATNFYYLLSKLKQQSIKLPQKCKLLASDKISCYSDHDNNNSYNATSEHQEEEYEESNMEKYCHHHHYKQHSWKTKRKESHFEEPCNPRKNVVNFLPKSSECCNIVVYAFPENVSKAYMNAHTMNRADAKTLVHLTNTYSLLPSSVCSSTLAQMTPRCYYPLVAELGAVLSSQCCLSDIYLFQFDANLFLHETKKRVTLRDNDDWVDDDKTYKRFKVNPARIRVADRELYRSVRSYLHRFDLKFCKTCEPINYNLQQKELECEQSVSERLYYAVVSFIKALLSTRLVLFWRLSTFHDTQRQVQFALCVSYEHYKPEFKIARHHCRRIRAEIRREERRTNSSRMSLHEPYIPSEPIVESLQTQLEWLVEALRTRGWIVIAQDNHYSWHTPVESTSLETPSHTISLKRKNNNNEEVYNYNYNDNSETLLEQHEKNNTAKFELESVKQSMEKVIERCDVNAIEEENEWNRAQNDFARQSEDLWKKEKEGEDMTKNTCSCSSQFSTTSTSNAKYVEENKQYEEDNSTIKTPATSPHMTNYTSWLVWQAALVPEEAGMHLWVGQHVYLLDGRCGVIHSFRPPPVELLDVGEELFFSSPSESKCNVTYREQNTMYSAICSEENNTHNNNVNVAYNKTSNRTEGIKYVLEEEKSEITKDEWLRHAYNHRTFLQWYISHVRARKRVWVCENGIVTSCSQINFDNPDKERKCNNNVINSNTTNLYGLHNCNVNDNNHQETNNEINCQDDFNYHNFQAHSTKLTLPQYMSEMECHAWPVIRLCNTNKLIQILPTDLRVSNVNYPTTCYVSLKELNRKQEIFYGNNITTKTSINNNNNDDNDDKKFISNDELFELKHRSNWSTGMNTTRSMSWPIQAPKRDFRVTIAILPIRLKAYSAMHDLYLHECNKYVREQRKFPVVKSYLDKYNAQNEHINKNKNNNNRKTTDSSFNCAAEAVSKSSFWTSEKDVTACLHKWRILHEVEQVCNKRYVVDNWYKMSAYLTSVTQHSYQEYLDWLDLRRVCLPQQVKPYVFSKSIILSNKKVF